jgi:hypothetical protein
LPSPKILLVSLGKLNGLLLQLLARRPGIGEIVVATRNVDRAQPIVNLARMGAAAEGFFPALGVVSFDLNQASASAETLAAIRPDLTLVAPSLQSWWVLDEIPFQQAKPLRPAGFGAWLPLQLLPMIRFMEAWRLSKLGTPILSAPYPDVVNPILATQGLEPTCGVGNVGELIPKLQCLLADRLSVPPDEVRVWLAAHHAIQKYVYRQAKVEGEPPPFLVSVEVGGREPSPEVDVRSLLLTAYALPQGLDFQFLTVGATIRVIAAFLEPPGRSTFLHVPAPAGLPGGYPVAVQDGAVRLDLPSRWRQEDAIEVNRVSHRWDGIDSVAPDGTVEFSEQTAGILREVLRYDWPRMRFEEVEPAANELRRRFDAYVGRSG